MRIIGSGHETEDLLHRHEVHKTHPKTLEVLVDNRCAMENVTRFAQNTGYEVAVKKDGGDFRLTLTAR